MDQRPKLKADISKKDFQEFYWLKKELVLFSKSIGLKTTGSKIDIAKRIIRFLETGKKEQSPTKPKRQPRSNFDWNNTALSLETVITDNYKNTENVRLFFEKQVGKQFKFNVIFMNWMKVNCGKTLDDAIVEWGRIKTEKANSKKTKEISPQFEYNRYLRDFMADNPNSKRARGIELWNLKKSRRGDNVYNKEDFTLLEGL